MEHKQIIPTLSSCAECAADPPPLQNWTKADKWTFYGSSTHFKESIHVNTFKIHRNSFNYYVCVRACEKRRVSVECYFWLFFPPFLTIRTLVTKAADRFNGVKAIYRHQNMCSFWGEAKNRKWAMPPTHKFLNTWLSIMRIYIYIYIYTRIYIYIANIRKAFALLGCYAAYVGSCLPTFRDSLFVPATRAKQSKKNAGQVVDPSSHNTLHRKPEVSTSGNFSQTLHYVNSPD
jgi:hypothetical protein